MCRHRDYIDTKRTGSPHDHLVAARQPAGVRSGTRTYPHGGGLATLSEGIAGTSSPFALLRRSYRAATITHPS